MKKTMLFSMGIFLSLSTSFSQNYDKDFGKPVPSELEMTVYSGDKSAEAVVLYDIGYTSFEENVNRELLLCFTRKTKIKIITKAGLDFAQVSIPLYSGDNEIEKITEVKGYTYNLENGIPVISKLDVSKLYVEKEDDHWSNTKFALPNVKEGSVIEFSYRVESPYFFNFQSWVFQRKIPVVYSEYKAMMVPFYEYEYIFQGAQKFDIYNVSKSNFTRNYAGIEFYDNIYTFGMKDVPAFRDEEFITSINDYIMKIDFQLSAIHYPNGSIVKVLSTWPEVIKDILKESQFGLYARSLKKESEALLTGLDLSSKTVMEKTRTIYDYVKGNFMWDHTSDKYAHETGKEFLRTKTGNSASINLFLYSMLNAAGIEAYPVLLSTRQHGKIYYKYPMLKNLNYVAVLVRNDKQDILLDATNPLCPFGMLPSTCINDKGLVVDKEKQPEEWIPLEDNAISEIMDSVHIAFNTEIDSVFYRTSISTQGRSALDYRLSYLSDPKSFKNELVTSLAETCHSFTIKNEQDLEKTFVVNFSTSLSTEFLGEKILVNPFIGLIYSENPLKLGYRSYPVDMIYKRKEALTAIIDIPEGYTYIPQKVDYSMDNAVARINYYVSVTGKQIIVNGSFNFKKAIYSNADYFDLKSCFSKIVENFNRKIVLVKL